MKTGTDTYIQRKQEHYDQDVIKSYNSYICHAPARKNTQTNTIPHFPTESQPSLDVPYPSANFPSPSFLRFFGKVTPSPSPSPHLSNYASSPNSAMYLKEVPKIYFRTCNSIKSSICCVFEVTILHQGAFEYTI